MAAVVEAENLVKIFPGKVTLYNFSLNIEEGGVFGLLGPNGAGKSTFIRILTGLESADSGKINLYGKPLSKESAKKIGVAPQENCVYPLLTCVENLLYFGSLYGVTGKKAKDNAERLLIDLGLADKKNTRAGFLSGGMKRRLNLACALMHEPKLLILDEPTTGLDPTTRRNMWNVVNKVSKENKATVILTTHYMEEAEALCYRIAFVNSGQVVAEGSTEELKKMAGKQIARMVSVPGDYESLGPLLKKIPGIESITITEAGIVVESDEVSSKVSEITRIFTKKGEKIVELSVSKPSLEDVFLKITGAQLKKEAVKGGPKK
jgi:ABC-2 type transport system ATP-binding protein